MDWYTKRRFGDLADVQRNILAIVKPWSLGQALQHDKQRKSTVPPKD